ncbi:hypothetical protein EDB85DRAFT_1897942 [Lactarius pseudohatsudake]|nr:hypothetical protein EDB85DRAFT_1897942 [Lactarius pseudohatsudake]
MHGVTFLSYDGPSTTDSHTLISLQRLYTSSAQPLSPPHRLFFPAVSTFTDHPGPNIGVAPETLKAAYPSLAGLLYAGDFYDFVGIGAPLLLASSSPTAVLRVVQDSLATCQPLEAVEDWFDPVRHTLAWYFGAPEEDTVAGTRTVTLFRVWWCYIDP